MRIPSEFGNYVSIERCSPLDDNDILVVVEVRTRGFTGRTDAWVLREAWLGFCEELALVEAHRQGAATIDSESPKELRLTIRSTDRAGHMAVEGFVGVRGADGDVLLTFSPMAIDPSILPDILREARAIAG